MKPMKFYQIPSLREKVPAICQHELGHWLAALHVGFEAHEIKVAVTHLGEGHRGEAHLSLWNGLRSVEDITTYLRRRIFVLFAGVCSEMLDSKTGKIDRQKACDDLENGGAIQDFAKVRELLRMLEGIAYPDSTDEAGHKKQLKELQDGIWDQVVAFVEGNNDLIVGVGGTIASKGVETETPFGMGEADLKSIPMIKDWLALHQTAAQI